MTQRAQTAWLETRENCSGRYFCVSLQPHQVRCESWRLGNEVALQPCDADLLFIKARLMRLSGTLEKKLFCPTIWGTFEESFRKERIKMRERIDVLY